MRQKLAALYYGKGDVRRAFDLLQSGIELNHNGETLRIALAKLLMKENQTEAALSPLSYLPQSPSVEYLSLRAALAQKSKFNDIALESYQLLHPKRSQQWALVARAGHSAGACFPAARGKAIVSAGTKQSGACRFNHKLLFAIDSTCWQA